MQTLAYLFIFAFLAIAAVPTPLLLISYAFKKAARNRAVAYEAGLNDIVGQLRRAKKHGVELPPEGRDRLIQREHQIVLSLKTTYKNVIDTDYSNFDFPYDYRTDERYRTSNSKAAFFSFLKWHLFFTAEEHMFCIFGGFLLHSLIRWFFIIICEQEKIIDKSAVKKQRKKSRARLKRWALRFSYPQRVENAPANKKSGWQKGHSQMDCLTVMRFLFDVVT